VGQVHGRQVIVSVRIVDAKTRQPLSVVDLDGPVTAASFTAPNSLVAAVGGAVSLHIAEAKGLD
jgi:hypothetical protein